MDAIIWGLQQWRAPNWDANLPAGPFVSNQSAIGWEHFLDGWLARSWQDYQEGLWQSVQSRCSGKCWIAELIKKLWNVPWDMWAHRNGILHQSPMARQEILEKQVNNQIHGIYAGGTQALPRDAFGFVRKPLEQTLHLSLPAKQQWLESVHNAIQRKKKHEYGKYASEQRFMNTWLIHS